MKNVLKPLAKCVLMPVGLTAVASAAGAGTSKNILVSGRPYDLAQQPTTLINSNEEMKNMRIIKCFEKFDLFIGADETIKSKSK